MTIGFIGGTGPEGRGLALRFAMAGDRVLIGSRAQERAQQAAQGLASNVPPGSIVGALNQDVAREAGIVFITIPFEGQRDTLEALKEELADKVVVNVIAPVVFSRGKIRAMPVEEGSAAQQAQGVLTSSKVVAAFQNVSAEDLLVPEKPIDCDVVVCSDDAEGKAAVMSLAEKIKGVRAVDGGALENARYVEELTALLLNINRIYKGRSMIKIVGI